MLSHGRRYKSDYARSLLWVDNGGSVPFAFQVDQLSMLFLLIITGVGFLIHLYSTSYMHEEAAPHFARYFSYLNLFVFSMLLLVLGANFIMMNLQYVPAVVALPDEEEYAQAMADVAKEKGVGLFRRFEIMKSWYNDGMPYAQFVINDGLHLNDFGQKCTARLLSQSILDAINPKQLTGAAKSAH